MILLRTTPWSAKVEPKAAVTFASRVRNVPYRSDLLGEGGMIVK